MDSKRFDNLTRQLATGQSRRSVIKGLLGLTGGTAIAATQIDDSNARRRGSSGDTTPPPDETTVCPGDAVECGSECCSLSQSCCDDGCCDGACTAIGTCCSAPNTSCGPDCCSPDTQCCGGECCPGVCYGEELCCPAPRIFNEISWACCEIGTRPCGELCILDGSCCNDDECAGLTDVCTIGRCSEPGGSCFVEATPDGTPLEEGVSVCLDGAACTLATCDGECGFSVNDGCGGAIVCCGCDAEVGCTANAECCSGYCVNGTCVGGPGIANASCDETADCSEGLVCEGGACKQQLFGDCSFDPSSCAAALVCDLLGGNICKIPNGHLCSTTGECAFGNECDMTGGTCKVANGFGCQDDTECVDGYCIATGCQNGPSEQGGPCDSANGNGDCQPGLICDGRLGTDLCLQPLGGVCVASNDCASGYVCDGAPVYQCKFEQGAGPCSSNDDCSSSGGDWCDPGSDMCVPLLPPGDACADGGQCGTGVCGTNANGNTSVCCVAIDVGAACLTEADCCDKPGPLPAICRNGICQSPGNSGDICEKNSDCSAALICRAGLCDQPDSGTTGEDCFKNSECVSGLVCCLDEDDGDFQTCVESSQCPGPPKPVGKGGICEETADCAAGLTCINCATGGTEKRCLDRDGAPCCRNNNVDTYWCGDASKNACCGWECVDILDSEEHCGTCEDDCFELSAASACWETGAGYCDGDGNCVQQRVCGPDQSCNPGFETAEDGSLVDYIWGDALCTDRPDYSIESSIGDTGWPCSKDPDCNSNCYCTSPCTGGWGGIWCTEQSTCTCP